jgi:purine-binding chemotaxis protein CheW
MGNDYDVCFVHTKTAESGSLPASARQQLVLQGGFIMKKAEGGKYLIFKLGTGLYGVEILKVQEIIGMLPVTPLPLTSADVRGLINLRGKIIPIVDLRASFGCRDLNETARTCIIVVRTKMHGEDRIVGMVVDSVAEVLEITEDRIDPPPEICAARGGEVIYGIGKQADGVVALLDIDQAIGLTHLSEASLETCTEAAPAQEAN